MYTAPDHIRISSMGRAAVEFDLLLRAFVGADPGAST
jgi:hypothetical protein